MSKLAKNTLPSGHTKENFKCFGPVATKDGVFTGTCLADLGCFNQDGKDSNKYYHGAVVQSTLNSKWYAYFEYGKTGANTVGFQFIECNSKQEAQEEYESQMHAKNDKRGMWVDHKVLGKILQAKPGKDCYLVRPQTVRSTGLPDALTITTCATTATVVAPVNGRQLDKESVALLNDLNVSTTAYTRSSMSNNCIPTEDAIAEARKILLAATDVINHGNDERELTNLTNLLYGRIPKKKNRSDKDFLLSAHNIQLWSDDLDAFESALLNNGKTQTTVIDNLPFHLEWLSPKSELGNYIHSWMPHATRNRHGGVGKLTIVNAWKIEKKSDLVALRNKQKQVVKSSKEEPLHQIRRIDLDSQEIQDYNNSGTYMLFHGTRSVNVSGILRESLRLPAQLKGSVVITGAMFGPGMYFADDWKKSAGYTSTHSSYWARGEGQVGRRHAFMFITDVVLGNPYVAPRSQNYQGPPSGHHSIYGKAGHSGVANNEFIVFEKSQHYLRYLVEFKEN
jgi:hypothetical protein